MGKWTKNHRMSIGIVLFLLGLALTVVSFTYRFAASRPAWLESYATLVNRPEGDYNLFLILGGPVVLVWGAWYIGEQLIFRRRFERLIDTPKKSEFSSRRRELEDIAKKLPDAFVGRIKEKEAEFVSRRV